jgi:RNA polymerase-binding transcription factor DksA
VVVPDPADRATIEEEHALELRTRDRERKLLKKIEQSIAASTRATTATATKPASPSAWAA